MFSQLLTEVDAGHVRDVTIAGPDISGHYKDGHAFQTYAPSDPQTGRQALHQGRRDHRQAAVGRQFLAADPADQWAAAAAVPRRVDLHVPPDAGRRRQGDGIWQVEGQAAQRGAGPRDVRGRRRRRRGQGRLAGDRRIPARSAEVPETRRQNSARRAAGRSSGHRQDADRARRRRRSERAVLHDFRLRLRRNVRRRRREPRARHVRAGEEERALHHLHRRNRRGRPPSRRRPRRRQRRARADAQSVAGRDGRFRAERRHHHHRGDQPPRRAGPGAAAARPLRPPDRDLEPRFHRPREDPARARAKGAARAGRRSEGRRARHARLLRRGSDEPRQRVGAARRPARQARRHAAGVRGLARQDHDGRRAPHADDDRGGEEPDRLSRGGPCAGLAVDAGLDADPQGDDHPARARARHGAVAARARPDHRRATSS